MNNILKINGLEYIKLSKFKELEKKKVKIKEKIKEVEKVVKKEPNLKEYSIMDPCNVCCILPIKKDEGEIDEIDTALGFFKKVDKPTITLDYTSLKEGEFLLINGTKISKEYVDQIKKIASVWFSNKPEIFMMYTKEKETFEKDCPVMFLFDYSMCFVIAPRVESGDGDGN